MTEATLNTKHQIVVPREAREALGIKPGDKLVVIALGSQVIVLRKAKRYATVTKGAARGMYPPGYLKGERASWE